MKNADKYPLMMQDDIDTQLDEAGAQFILSLAPDVKVKWEDIDLIFDEDKVGREYYYTRQLQLNASIELSKASGQYKLYENYFRPVSKLLSSQIKPELDEGAMNDIHLKMDEVYAYICTQSSCALNPCNPTDLARMMKIMNLPPDPRESLEIDFEHSNLVRAICQLLDMNESRVYLGTVEEMSVPTWEPDKSNLTVEAFDKGYFTGPCKQRFYTPLCKKGIISAMTTEMQTEARKQMYIAKQSKLSAYKLIIEESLNPIHITPTKVYHTIF